MFSREVLLFLTISLLLPFPALSEDCDFGFAEDVDELEKGLLEDCNRNGVPDVCDMQPVGLEFAETGDSISSSPVVSLSPSMALRDINSDDVPDGFFLGYNSIDDDPDERKVFLYLSRSDGSGFDKVEIDLEPGFGASLRLGKKGVDIYTGGEENAILFENDGFGNFTSKPVARELPDTIRALADISGDGRKDLIHEFVEEGESGTIYRYAVEIANGEDSFDDIEVLFSTEDLGANQEVVAKDFDSDGISDIIFFLPSENGTTLRVYRGRLGSAPLFLHTHSLPETAESFLAYGKFDSQSGHDLMLGGRELLLVRDFTGEESELSLTPVPLPVHNPLRLSSSPSFTDLDADGDLDLSTTFTHIYSFGGRPATDSYELLFLNNGDSGFSLAETRSLSSSYLGGPVTRGPSIFSYSDWDKDGRVERLTASSSIAFGPPYGLSFSSIDLLSDSIEWPSVSDRNYNLVPDSCEVDGLHRYRFSLWNSYNKLTNIVELTNLETFPVRTRVRMRDLSGEVLEEFDIPLGAKGQFDVILNELPSFQTSGYGVLETISSGEVSGSVTYYRQTPGIAQQRATFDTGEFDFAFQLPLSPPSYTEGNFIYNTLQPSANGKDASFPVNEWITIVSLGNERTEFHVESRTDRGELLRDELHSLLPFGRIDIDGGHGIAPFTRGTHLIRPPNESPTPFLALMTRYGVTADSDRLAFAFPQFLHKGDDLKQLAVSTGGGAQNWIEVANTSNLDSTLYLNVTGGTSNGDTIQFPLAPYGHYHIRANEILGSNAHGIARVSGLNVSAQSLSYFYAPATGEIQSAYLSQFTNTNKVRSFRASYNTYLGAYNWAKLTKLSGEDREATLSLYGGGSNSAPIFTASQILTRGETVTYDLHNSARFGTAENTYGLTEFTLFGTAGEWGFEFLRIKPTASGGFDFVMPILNQ